MNAAINHLPVDDGFEHAGLRCRQQLAHDVKVVTARSRRLQRQPKIEDAGAGHDLVLDRLHGLPDLVLLDALRCVLAVGAALAVQAEASSGAGGSLLPAAMAIFGPSARPEVPAAEGPDAFFAALMSTCRSVNS